MTPSDWLRSNLTDVIVAVAQANVTLAGTVPAQIPQASAPLQEGSHDAGTV